MIHWQNTIQQLIQKPELHARFLNTLSLLEFIGARKIMKSQQEELVTPTVLSHATEEIRHAQIIKKLAIKLGGKSVINYEPRALLCGQEARNYIHGIDYKAQEVLGESDSWRNYLLTTLIIEERAQELYPYYDAALTPIGLGGPLQTIVREEVGHLEEVVTKLKIAGNVSDDMINAVRNHESMLYLSFFRSVDAEIATETQVVTLN
jgi:hypothetical protein